MEDEAAFLTVASQDIGSSHTHELGQQQLAHMFDLWLAGFIVPPCTPSRTPRKACLSPQHTVPTIHCSQTAGLSSLISHASLMPAPPPGALDSAGRASLSLSLNPKYVVLLQDALLGLACDHSYATQIAVLVLRVLPVSQAQLVAVERSQPGHAQQCLLEVGSTVLQ